jgi:hypothetical protein
LRKFVIIFAAGDLWLALRPPSLSQEKITEMLKAQGEVEDSVKCGHNYHAGSSAYVQCMAQLDAHRTQGLPQERKSTLSGADFATPVTDTVARVSAVMVMLIVFAIMMLVFYGFWALGTWIGAR